MGRRLLFDDEARRAIGRGVAQLARAVRVTLGPRGRTVVVEHTHAGPTITSDGAAVAREIELKNPFENLGVRLVREAAERTSTDAGDGASTATVLADALLRGGLALLAAGASPTALKRGMDLAVKAVTAHVRTQARPLASFDERAGVAAIAAAGDTDLGALVARALDAVGPRGAVAFEEGAALDTRVVLRPGLALERGYVSPYFVNDPAGMRCELVHPLVLLASQALVLAEEIAPALSIAHAEGAPLLVLAEDISAEALATLVVNQLRGVAQACAVPAPFQGAARRAWLEDAAFACGATLFADDTGRAAASVTRADLGRFAQASVERQRTVLALDPDAELRVKERADALRARAEAELSRHDRERGLERAASLSGGVARILVGGATASEIAERRGRGEDALAALTAALAEGVVPGGGVALVRARHAALSLPLEGDAKHGARLVADALTEPARWIASNAGEDGELVVARLLASGGATGFDASLGAFVDLERAGVLDAARVVRIALENAASVTGLLLTTDAIVVEDERGGADPGDAPA